MIDMIKYERLLKIAKAMHTWIFLHTGDEQKAYDEIGLTDEENAILGYDGRFLLEQPNEGYFGVVRWCNDDIVGLLEEMGVQPTEENVSAVRCACENNHHFTDDMVEAGWGTLEFFARSALGLSD